MSSTSSILELLNDRQRIQGVNISRAVDALKPLLERGVDPHSDDRALSSPQWLKYAISVVVT